MVDTIRTIGELNTLLADNATGDISAQDLRDVLVSQLVHTEIGRGALTTNIGTSYVKIPMTVAGTFERGFTANVATDQIDSTPVALKALITVEVQLGALDAGRTVDFAVFVNGVEAPKLTRTFTADYAPQHLSWSVGVQLAQNDTIDLRVKADQAATGITVEFVVLRAQRIGVE